MLSPADVGALLARVDPQEFISWLAYHRLEVYLAKLLADDDRIPVPAALGMDFRSQLNQARALFVLLLTSARRVFQQLEASAIPAMMLRGPAAAMAYYPEPFMRYCRDIDIIVRPEHLEAAEKTLRSIGFQLKGSRQYWQKKGELPFSDGRVTIELHQNPYPLDVASSCSPDSFWLKPDTIVMDGLSVQGLNPNHLLFSSCMHLSCEHKFDRLIRLIDIRQVLKINGDKIDWNWMVDQASGSYVRLALWQALRFARESVNARVPADVLRELAPKRLTDQWITKIFPPRALLATPSNSSRLRRFLFFKLLKLRAR